MAVKATKTTTYQKQETTLNWIARYLWRLTTRRGEREDKVETKAQVSLVRPQTAPSIGTASNPFEFSTAVEPPLVRPLNKPPPRPPRPDSDVMENVNAWLDASLVKPGPRLMGGIPYWREGAFTGSMPSSDVRYAVPIVRTSEVERPATSHSQHIKSFCRRAKRMHVRMPSLLRTKSQCVTVIQRKQASRRSTSLPLLSLPHENNSTPMARPLVRSRSLAHNADRSTPITSSIQGERWVKTRYRQLLTTPRLDTPASGRLDDYEASIGRRTNAVFGQSKRAGYVLLPPTASSYIAREDSMGNLSDAPTYFSGMPPPSYRSRAASVVTTSSFGCIDGMNAERRQISQRRLAQRGRGMKGKFRKLAQKAHFTK